MRKDTGMDRPESSRKVEWRYLPCMPDSSVFHDSGA